MPSEAMKTRAANVLVFISGQPSMTQALTAEFDRIQRETAEECARIADQQRAFHAADAIHRRFPAQAKEEG